FAGVAFTNSGSASLEAGNCQFGTYSQTAGSTTLGGSMSASDIQLSGGVLSGVGAIQCGTFVNSALVSPGASPGAIVITGPYTQTAQGRLAVEVGGATATQFDSLQVSGPAALAGQLDLSIINNYQPAQIDSIPIITATQVSGQFAVVNGGAVGSGQALRPQYTLA